MQRLIMIAVLTCIEASASAAPKLLGSGTGTGSSRAAACDMATSNANRDLEGAQLHNQLVEKISKGLKVNVRDCVCTEPDPKNLYGFWSCQVMWTLNYDDK